VTDKPSQAISAIRYWRIPTRLAAPVLLAPLLVFLLVFFLVPLGEVAWLSVSEPKLGFGHYIDIVAQPFLRRVVADTLVTSLIVTVACLLLGYPLAYVMAQLGGPLSSVMVMLVAMSFWTSYLVRTYAWMILLGNSGPVAATLAAFGWTPPPLLLFTRFSSTLALVHILLPIMIMALYAVMKKIDANVMRAASSLGATPFAAFRSVYLPLSAPGIVSGSTIVFVLCTGFYVTPVLIGSPREQMIAGIIGSRIEEFLAFGEASAIAMTLLVVTVAILAVYHRLFGLDRLWG
jgi:putative spermidine/putrescine transport system permease protein